MINDSYIIRGGHPLKGRVNLSGAKNVSLKMIIAALMFDGKVVLENVPRINDVLDLIELIKSHGVQVKFTGNRVEIMGTTNSNKVDLVYGSKIRVSFMLFAPLLFRHRQCFVPNPGGCRIGARPIDRIIDGMKSLGVEVFYDSETGYYRAEISDSPKGYYRFTKPSHTGTELLILLGIMTNESVEIDNAAVEPEIDELISFLNLSGANIKKAGGKIIIKKSLPLRQSKPFRVKSDRNELVTFATLGLASKGDVVVGPIFESAIASFLAEIKKVGATVEKIDNDYYRFVYKTPLHGVEIETAPHPGFMTDWQPNFAVLLMTAKGVSTITERVFENRFSYVEELRKLGAKMDFFERQITNPEKYYFFNYVNNGSYQQSVRIEGDAPLHNAILNIKDLRAGAALACAALLVPGESVVNGVAVLERGYENFVDKVKSLGGDIKKA